MPDGRSRWRRRSVVIPAAVVVVAAGGTSAWALTSGSGPAYRMASVTQGAVQQTLVATGTLAALHQASADFQVAGTVGKVDVKVGDRVKAGQQVATLRRSTLRAAVSAANAALQRAQAQLTSDQNGQLSAASTADASPTDAGNNRLEAARARPAPSPSTTANVTADQAALREAQHRADADLATATAALHAETAACQAESTSTTAPSPTTSATAASGPGGATTGSCTDAAATLLSAQRQVQADQQAVSQAETTLSNDLAAATSTPRSNQPSPAGTPSTGNPSGRKPTSSGTGSTTPTAGALASDQSSIDSARADLATARANLRQATLTSPITGRVIALGIAKGDSVSGSSSSSGPAVQVRGSGQTKVTIDVSATQVRKVRTGMAATVTPDGSSTPIHGRVVSVTSTGKTSSTGTVTYPVTIHLPKSATVVPGAAAAVSVLVASVPDALTVPTSAVHYTGSTAYVEMLRDGSPSRHAVTVKAVGAARTQITSGLSAGQRVVLADLNAAVPSSSTTSSNRPGGGFGPALNIQRFSGPGGSGVRVTVPGSGG
ncbi:MAG TPA: HlyD family efflux transporter periplasmic adaptor subunit [Mycobacteriales bacterium]|nr:HlyD family efflux transporter periplasmic adaptor subunit [Mycobacteriales bacterium]